MDMRNNGLQLNLFEEEAEPAIPEKQYDHTLLFERLAQSVFRSKFRLSAKDKAYIGEKGMTTIRSHAQDFVAKQTKSWLPIEGYSLQVVVILRAMKH